MNKHIIRFVAVLLMPCLWLDPATASGLQSTLVLSHSSHLIGSPIEVFQQEAFAELALANSPITRMDSKLRLSFRSLSIISSILSIALPAEASESASQLQSSLHISNLAPHLWALLIWTSLPMLTLLPKILRGVRRLIGTRQDLTPDFKTADLAVSDIGKINREEEKFREDLVSLTALIIVTSFVINFALWLYIRDTIPYPITWLELAVMTFISIKSFHYIASRPTPTGDSIYDKFAESKSEYEEETNASEKSRQLGQFLYTQLRRTQPRKADEIYHEILRHVPIFRYENRPVGRTSGATASDGTNIYSGERSVEGPLYFPDPLELKRVVQNLIDRGYKFNNIDELFPEVPSLSLEFENGGWTRVELSIKQGELIDAIWETHRKSWDQSAKLKSDDPIASEIESKFKSDVNPLAVRIYAPSEDEIMKPLKELTAARTGPQLNLRTFRLAGYLGKVTEPNSVELLISREELEALRQLKKTVPDAYEQWLTYVTVRIRKNLRGDKSTEKYSINEFLRSYNDLYWTQIHRNETRKADLETPKKVIFWDWGGTLGYWPTGMTRGAANFLAKTQSAGLQNVLVTSAPREEVYHWLQTHDLQPYFSEIICPANKDEVFDKAQAISSYLERHQDQLLPSEAIGFGDDPVKDLAAFQKAGIASIGVLIPNTKFSEDQLWTAGAAAIIRNALTDPQAIFTLLPVVPADSREAHSESIHRLPMILKLLGIPSFVWLEELVHLFTAYGWRGGWQELTMQIIGLYLGKVDIAKPHGHRPLATPLLGVLASVAVGLGLLFSGIIILQVFGALTLLRVVVDLLLIPVTPNHEMRPIIDLLRAHQFETAA